MTQLLGINFGLKDLWCICHGAELELVNALPVVGLGTEVQEHVTCSTLGLAPLLPPHQTESQSSKRNVITMRHSRIPSKEKAEEQAQGTVSKHQGSASAPWSPQ